MESEKGEIFSPNGMVTGKVSPFLKTNCHPFLYKLLTISHHILKKKKNKNKKQKQSLEGSRREE